MADFTERDIQAVRLSAESMVRVANESLRIANTSRNLATRASRLNVAKVNVQRLKELSAEYPFLRLTSLAAFEDSIRKVEQETAAITAGSAPERETNEPALKAEADPFLQLSLPDQCEFLGIRLEVVDMEKDGREWLFSRSTFKKPEAAALAYFEDQGFIGASCEGAASLMLMKCASLDYLAQVNTFKSRADACMRYFEAQCWLHSHRSRYIMDEIAASAEEKVRANFREIASQPNYSAVYPAMDEDVLIAIWRAMTPSRLAQLAGFIFRDQGYRAGWPDLTLARGKELRFVEVKTSDRLHSSQKTVLSEVLTPWGASVSVMRLRATR